MIEFTNDARKEFEEILDRYPSRRAALLQVLILAQREFGWISGEVAEYVGSLMELSPSDVLSVASFYTMLRKKPVGKYHLEICRNVTCWMKGNKDCVEEIKRLLNIGVGETTPDGKFTLSWTECLGSCGTAPAMMMGDRYYENLTPEKVREIIKKLADD